MSTFIRAIAFPLVAALATGPGLRAAEEPDYVTTRDFKSRVFEIRYRNPDQLRHILRGLLSGHKGSDLVASSGGGLATLTVRDYPENVAAIEEALKRLDVPAPAQKEVAFTFHILLASRTDRGGEPLPEGLRPVVAALRSTLAYKGYALLATLQQRAMPGSQMISGRGTVDWTVPVPKGEDPSALLEFRWMAQGLRAEPSPGGPATVSLERFSFQAMEKNRPMSEFQTDLTLRSGVPVVVGTSALRDRGLVVVVTAQVEK